MKGLLWHVSRALAIALFIAVQDVNSTFCEQSGIGYDCAMILTLDFALHWSTLEDGVSFAAVVNSTGYVGVGFPTTPEKMSGADAVVGSRSAEVHPYVLGNYAFDGIVDENQTLSDACIEVEGGLTIMKFTRAFDNGGSYALDPSGANPMIFAHSSDDSDAFVYHGSGRGFFNVDLSLKPACGPSQLGYECQQAVTDEYVVHWTYADGVAMYAVELGVDEFDGWVGIGFPAEAGAMVGSDAVIGSSALGVHPYKLGGKSVADVVLDASQTISDSSLSVVDGKTVMKFSRAYDNGGSYVVDPSASSAPLLYVYSPSSPQLGYHGGTRGGFVVSGGDSGGGGSDDDNNDDSGGGGLCDPSSLGLACQLRLGASFTLHWTAERSGGNSSSVKFALEARTDGWVAVGFSMTGDMVRSDAVIGRVEEGVGSVEPYILEEYSVAGVQADPLQTISDTSVSQSNGVTVVRFTRALNNGGQAVIAATGPNRMVWAHSADNSAALAYHQSSKGQFSVDFSTGAGSKANPFNYVLLHGALMVTAWAFLIPGGVLVARFFKHLGHTWFVLHRGVQTVALCVAIAGLVVAVQELNAGSSSHRSLGWAVMALGVAQPFNALLRPKPEAEKRYLWNWVHWTGGGGALLLAFVNMFLGLQKAHDRDGWLDEYKSLRVAVITGISCFGAAIVALQTQRWLATDQATGGQRASGERSSAAAAESESKGGHYGAVNDSAVRQPLLSSA